MQLQHVLIGQRLVAIDHLAVIFIFAPNARKLELFRQLTVHVLCEI